MKEVAAGRSWKARMTYWQEFLAVRVLGITAGRCLLFSDTSELASAVREAGFSEIEVAQIGHGYPYDHVLVLARKPGETPQQNWGIGECDKAVST